MRLNRILLLPLIVVLLLPAVWAADQPSSTPLIPRELLFGNPERTSPRISPDGTRLAYLAPDSKGVLNVWVRTIGQTDDQVITADKKRGIRQFNWQYDSQTGRPTSGTITITASNGNRAVITVTETGYNVAITVDGTTTNYVVPFA